MKSPPVVSVAPWLSVRNGARAMEFYEAAFGAGEVYHIEDLAARRPLYLSIGCISDGGWKCAANEARRSPPTQPTQTVLTSSRVHEIPLAALLHSGCRVDLAGERIDI